MIAETEMKAVQNVLDRRQSIIDRGQLAHALVYRISGERPPIDFCDAWWWVARSAEALNGSRDLTIHCYIAERIDAKTLEYCATGRS